MTLRQAQQEAEAILDLLYPEEPDYAAAIAKLSDPALSPHTFVVLEKVVREDSLMLASKATFQATLLEELDPAGVLRVLEAALARQDADVAHIAAAAGLRNLDPDGSVAPRVAALLLEATDDPEIVRIAAKSVAGKQAIAARQLGASPGSSPGSTPTSSTSTLTSTSTPGSASTSTSTPGSASTSTSTSTSLPGSTSTLTSGSTSTSTSTPLSVRPERGSSTPGGESSRNERGQAPRGRGVVIAVVVTVVVVVVAVVVVLLVMNGRGSAPEEGSEADEEAKTVASAKVGGEDGAGVSAEVNEEAGIGVQADTEAQTESEAGSETGPKTGSETGIETGSETGTETGSETGADAFEICGGFGQICCALGEAEEGECASLAFACNPDTGLCECPLAEGILCGEACCDPGQLCTDGLCMPPPPSCRDFSSLDPVPPLECSGENCPQTCLELLQSEPSTDSGQHWVHPEGSAEPFLVLCDMTYDGGGWTLVGHERSGQPEQASATGALAYLWEDNVAPEQLALGEADGLIGTRFAFETHYGELRLDWCDPNVGENLYQRFRPEAELFADSAAATVDTVIPLREFSTNDVTFAGLLSGPSSAAFCRAATSSDRPGDTSWAVKAVHESSFDCGCNSGGWAGSGTYYGGTGNACSRCDCWGGGWAGSVGSGEQKGGKNNFAVYMWVR